MIVFSSELNKACFVRNKRIRVVTRSYNALVPEITAVPDFGGESIIFSIQYVLHNKNL